MQRVVITGANRGLGLGLVKGFRALGDCVLATARQPERAGDLLALREKEAGEDHLRIYSLDLASPESIAAFAAEMLVFPGSIDLLINNAGVYPEKGSETLEELDLALMETAWRVNVLGTARLTQALLPLLRRSASARIVNISSGTASVTTKTDHRHYCYGLSKAALNFFTRGLAAELKPHGIPVVALSPGWVRTEMGGPEAELSVEESCAAMVPAMRGLEMAQSGLFLDRYGNPEGYPW